MTATLDRRADYVSAVAVELGDLPAEERAELIEELDDHVAALLEDRPDVDLVAELGTPRAYAVELRSAAGLVGTGRASRVTLRQRWTVLVARVDARIPDAARPLLAALKPVWWVFRGYVLLTAACHVLGLGWSGSGLGSLLPAPGGLWPLGLVLAVAAAAVSVRLGSWRPRGPGPRAALIALDLLAVIGALMLSGSARHDSGGELYYDTQYVPNCPVELDNLYAYDASGKPLDGVRLYDQYGTPFDLSTFGCNVSGQFAPGPDGANAYPWPEYTYGRQVGPTGPPSSLAPLPGATVSSGGSASGAPSGSPAASATPSGPAASPSPTS